MFNWFTVSIRAPARGATDLSDDDGSADKCFNPRPRTGGDVQEVISITSMRTTDVSIRAPARGATSGASTGRPIGAFQSAPPHGGRQSLSSAKRRATEGFNPRPRTGGDATMAVPKFAAARFNPRPRTGGDKLNNIVDQR